MIDDLTDVGDGGDIDVGGAAGGAAAPAAGTKDAAPAKLGWKDALAQVRTAIGATKGADDPGHAGAAPDDGAGAADAAPAETAEAREERLSALSPEDRAAAEAVEAEAAAGGAGGTDDEALIVDLGAFREGEEPIRIQAADQQMADQLRALKNRAATHDASLKIRDQAEGYIQQAEEMRYEVQLDPGGFLLENLKGPNGTIRSDDAAHIVRVLLTQGGVLDAPIRADGTTLKDWMTALAAHPAAIPQEAEIAEAARVKRAAERKPLVERLRFEHQNARALMRSAYNTVDQIVPDTWTQEQRDQLVSDVSRDLQDAQQRENVRVTDPRRVPGFVERRLKAFGVAPKAKTGTAGAGAGRDGTKSPARTGPSGQQLVKTDEARRRAAAPGPGAGSPAAGIPKPPAGTKLTGKDNAFDFVRKHLATLRRAPQ